MRNGGAGIHVATPSNTIQHNRIGVHGSLPAGNAGDGILVTAGASGNLVGGTLSGGNIIGDNGGGGPTHAGITTRGTFTRIRGNHIGITPSRADVGNHGPGIAGLDHNQTEVDGNTIGFNALGMSLAGEEYVITGNWVGTDANGARAGNDGDGIIIDGVNNEVTGRNIIAYNGVNGVVVMPGSTAAYIQGNVMSSNAAVGVIVLDTISALVDANDIMYNDTGIRVPGAASQAWISNNSMFGNFSYAIDNGNDGTASNDPDDADTGPNGLMNNPEILGWALIPGSPPILEVDYTLEASAANVQFPVRIELYWTDREEIMQGRYFLGHNIYDTPGAVRTIAKELPFDIDYGKFALRAIDDGYHSSEFSFAVIHGQIDLLLRDSFESLPPFE